MKPFVLGILRHVLTYGGGLLMAKGWGDSGDWETIIGAIIAIVGAVWSMWDKHQAALRGDGGAGPLTMTADDGKPVRRAEEAFAQRTALLAVALGMLLYLLLPLLIEVTYRTHRTYRTNSPEAGMSKARAALRPAPASAGANFKDEIEAAMEDARRRY